MGGCCAGSWGCRTRHSRWSAGDQIGHEACGHVLASAPEDQLKRLQVLENMERETGIGPATNSLEGCDSTIELLPLRAVSPYSNAPPIALHRLADGVGLAPA